MPLMKFIQLHFNTVNSYQKSTSQYHNDKMVYGAKQSNAVPETSAKCDSYNHYVPVVCDVTPALIMNEWFYYSVTKN